MKPVRMLPPESFVSLRMVERTAAGLAVSRGRLTYVGMVLCERRWVEREAVPWWNRWIEVGVGACAVGAFVVFAWVFDVWVKGLR